MLTAAEMPSRRGVTLNAQRDREVVYDSGDYPQSLRAVTQLIDADGFRAEQSAARAAGRFIGLGYSVYVEGTAFGPYEYAAVAVDAEGRVTLTTGSSPHGQGTATTHAQLVADELGIDIDAISVVHGDTSLVKDGVGTWGSRGGAVGGTAARLAARRLTEIACVVAAPLLGASPEAVRWSNGRVRIDVLPGRSLSLMELAQHVGELRAEFRFDVPDVAYAYAAHAAVVDVDVATGRIAVLRYGVAHDCGRVVNPRIVEAQVVGGVAQGIGGTLFEEIVYDERGTLLTRSHMDYLLPSAADIPDIALVHTETPTPHNPFGMKGTGEGGATGSPAALVNAIEDALRPFGIQLNDDGPYTPSRVMELLEEARRA
jgi:carbon-monoxide dehydrogenase large subunit